MQKYYGISVIKGKYKLMDPLLCGPKVHLKCEMGLWTFILKYEPRLRTVNRSWWAGRTKPRKATKMAGLVN